MITKSKSMCFVVGMVLAITILVSGCSITQDGGATTKGTTQQAVQTTTEADPHKDHVKLIFYVLGSEKEDNKMVWDEINKRLTEKINAEVELKYMSYGDYKQKYPLLFSAGEDFDMIYTANWSFYAETATKGGFYELTQELLNKYAPLTMKSLPEEAWKSTRINGKNYMIPQNNRFPYYGFVVRQDLREKYGLPEITNIDELENFLNAVKENEPDMIPINIYANKAEAWFRTFVLYPAETYYLTGSATQSTLVFNHSDPSVFDVKSYFDLDGTMEYLKRIQQWNKKGFLSQSDLTSTDQERFTSGRSAVDLDNLDGANEEWLKAKQDHPDWKVEFANVLKGKKLAAQGFQGNATGFNAKSKNITRAIEAVDLLGYDPDINFMVVEGIDGIHKEKVGTVKIGGETLRQTKALDAAGRYGGYSNWGLVNTIGFPLEALPHYAEIMESYYFDQIVFHPLCGTSFNTEQINAEIASCTDILNTYQPILFMGFAENIEETLANLQAELKAAGIDKINEELIKQAKVIFDAAQ